MSTAPVTISGNLTHDPELRVMTSGTAKLSFSVACSHMWTDQSGEKQEKTSFFNIVAWRNLAEDAAEVLEKGLRVTVSGRLEQRTYEDKEGNNRSVVEVVADDIAVSCRAIKGVTRRERRSEGAPKGQSRGKPEQSGQSRLRVVEDEEPF
jgi:single-strand DNA-binding protein